MSKVLKITGIFILTLVVEMIFFLIAFNINQLLLFFFVLVILLLGYKYMFFILSKKKINIDIYIIIGLVFILIIPASAISGIIDVGMNFTKLYIGVLLIIYFFISYMVQLLLKILFVKDKDKE
jgi:hypothetical protein